MDIMLRKKHSSKLYKGFCKMCKEHDVTINIPQNIKLPKNFRGEYIHCINVFNNKWNGMNLKCLRSKIAPYDRIGHFQGTFIIKNGKYYLSNRGKYKLKKLKEKLTK